MFYVNLQCFPKATAIEEKHRSIGLELKECISELKTLVICHLSGWLGR